MNDSELNDILRRAKVPERPPEFWEDFPAQVMTKARRSADAPVRAITLSRFLTLASWRPALVTGLAALAAVVTAVLMLHQGSPSSHANSQLAAAQKYFREIEALFPHQLTAIEFDSAGAHLNLSDRPNVPASPPLYVSICGPRGCRRFVTFSGQKIRVNGDDFEVLVDRQGEVLVVGKQWVWPDPERAKTAPYRVEARPLPVNS